MPLELDCLYGEREGGWEGGWEGGTEVGGREAAREGVREGGSQGGRDVWGEGWREGLRVMSHIPLTQFDTCLQPAVYVHACMRISNLLL